MPRTKAAFLAEADELIHKTQFSREDASRVESILAMADRLPNDSETRELSRGLERLPVDREFRAYLAQGRAGLSADRRIEVAKQIQGFGTADTGAYLAPASFSQQYETVLKAIDGLFAEATTFESNTGNAMFYPLLDDVDKAAAIVGESQASSDADLIFAALSFAACPCWRSGQVRAPWEFQQDEGFNFESMLAAAFAKRVARGAGSAFIVKLLAAAGSGVTSASPTALTGDELYSLVDALDADYLPSATWCMRRATLTAIQKLKDTAQRYLFPPQYAADGSPLLLGFRVLLSPSMPAMTAGNKAITFGSHKSFVIRRVKNGTVVQSYPERYAELGQGCWQMLSRIDGGLLVGSVNPIVTLVMHS